MAQTPERVEVDLPNRREIRFVLPTERHTDVLALLSSLNFEPEIFSDRTVTRTIYFNNQAHEVPWGLSIKAREYFHQRSLDNEGRLDFNVPYLVEVKVGGAKDEKTKTRFKMRLGNAMAFLQESVQIPVLTSPIRPFVADEYERLHFRPKNGNSHDARITCDYSPSYFLIKEDGSVHLLTNERSARVEIKTAPGFQSPQITKLIDELTQLGGVPTISKKVTAYNWESVYYKDFGGKPVKDLAGLEIESKLVVIDRYPFQLFSILALRLREGLGGFRIQSTFPYINESGSINSYYQSEGQVGEGVKFLTRPTGAKAIFKSETEVVPDQYNLGCILKRRETKGAYFPAIAEEFARILTEQERQCGQPFRLVGQLERLRKAFWVKHDVGQRVYHVSIDKCDSGNKIFYELEIEYIGTKGNSLPSPEIVVVREIADLTKAIVDLYPQSFRVEPLTKLTWIKSQN